MPTGTNMVFKHLMAVLIPPTAAGFMSQFDPTVTLATFIVAGVTTCIHAICEALE